MIHQMNIQTKLIAGFSVVLAMGAANAVHTSIAVRGIRERIAAEISGSFKVLDDSRQITIGISNMRSAMRAITLFSLQKNPAQFVKAKSSFAAAADEMRKNIEQMDAGSLIPEDRDAIATIRSGLDEWVVNFSQFANSVLQDMVLKLMNSCYGRPVPLWTSCKTPRSNRAARTPYARRTGRALSKQRSSVRNLSIWCLAWSF